MNANFTTHEQSKRLVELGLNPDTTADMCYYIRRSTLGDDIEPMASVPYQKSRNGSILPCWTAAALINALPECIDNEDYWLKIEKNLYEHPERKVVYSIGYEHYNGTDDKYDRIVEEESLINAVYEMIVWILENGYL